MMTPIRLTVMAVTTCAAGLSLGACSAGITTASKSPSAGRTAPASSATASQSPSASRTAPASSAPASPLASSVDMVNVDSPLRTFPVPHGAHVIINVTCKKEVIIELGAITVSQASSFYNSVLPENGYKITSNTLIDATGNGTSGPNEISGPFAQIGFTGHGYKGTITALSSSEMASAGIPSSGIPNGMTGNVITIDMIPPGAAGCPTTAP